MKEHEEISPADERALAALLRAAGMRQRPPRDMTEGVRAAVHAEWRAAVAGRARPRVQLWLAAASIAVLAVAVLVARVALEPVPVIAAHVSRAVGEAESRTAWWRPSRPLVAGQALPAGARIDTGRGGRVALTLDQGGTLRLDRTTRVALRGTELVELLAGGVYVDSGLKSLAARLAIHTPAGRVRHVGTQYEVRLVESGTQVRVRSGRVELAPVDAAARSFVAGEEALMSARGVVARTRIKSTAPAWNWVSQVVPPFDIDGRPVSEFLDWIARESGRQIVFATPEAAAEAQRAVLSGSIEGLTPEQALNAVLHTTRFRSTLGADHVLIGFE